MRRFWTSDLHFGHARIIELCDRPFANVVEMDRALVERWNDTVGDDDVVWVLGDVCMGLIHDSLHRAAQLRGQKYLMPGNHDRCWPWYDRRDPAAGRYRDWAVEYEKAGFHIVKLPASGGLVGTELGTWGPAPGDFAAAFPAVRVWMSHFPYAGDSGPEERYAEHRPEPIDDGSWLLHGHVHEAWKVDRGRRMINVGVDVWDFAPVSEDQLLEVIAGDGE